MEKPLHVQVAEALGCHPRHFAEGWCCNCGQDALCERTGQPDGEPIPRFDTDWSATGPLIEKYRIDLMPIEYGTDAPHWRATVTLPLGEPRNASSVVRGSGLTPLIAVCNLILALKEAGKLTAQERVLSTT